MPHHPKRSRLSTVVLCALLTCIACGRTDDPGTNASSVDAPTRNATSMNDVGGGAVWGQRARMGPRRTADTDLVVVPQSADLDENSTAINFSVYDLEAGDATLAVHLPFALDDCDSVGYAVSVTETPDAVLVALRRGLRRGAQPCPERPNYNPTYGVVVAHLDEPLGGRTVLSVT